MREMAGNGPHGSITTCDQHGGHSPLSRRAESSSDAFRPQIDVDTVKIDSLKLALSNDWP